MNRFVAPLAFAIASLSSPAAAQTPDVLACMETGYAQEEQAAIDAFVAEFDLDSMVAGEALASALGGRAVECAGSRYEDEYSMLMIIEYRFAGLSLAGIAASRPDVVEVIRRIDNELPDETRARFYRIFETSVFGDPETGETRELTAEEEQFFTDTVLGAPVNGTVEQAELIGAYLAGRVMQKAAVEHFAGQ